MLRVIDLTREIYHRMKISPTFQTPMITDHLTHEETALAYNRRASFQVKALAMSDHTGTHVDAFTHAGTGPDKEPIDRIPVGRFYGEAICLDITHLVPGGVVSAADVEAQLARHGLEVRPGDTVLFRSAHYYPPEGQSAFAPVHQQGDEFHAYMRALPGLSAQVVHWLADRGANAVGVEGRSIDSPVNERSDGEECYPAHLACVERRILGIENLWLPEELVGKRFIYVGLPLKLRGATGSPIRAIAVLDE